MCQPPGCGTRQGFGLFCCIGQHGNSCVSGIGPWVPNNSFAGMVLDEKRSVAGVFPRWDLCWVVLGRLGLARQVYTKSVD